MPSFVISFLGNLRILFKRASLIGDYSISFFPELGKHFHLTNNLFLFFAALRQSSVVCNNCFIEAGRFIYQKNVIIFNLGNFTEYQIWKNLMKSRKRKSTQLDSSSYLNCRKYYRKFATGDYSLAARKTTNWFQMASLVDCSESIFKKNLS